MERPQRGLGRLEVGLGDVQDQTTPLRQLDGSPPRV